VNARPWNHNIQYFPFIEREVAREPRRSALDIGSGDGMLAARLARIVPAVVGLDLHEAQVDAASRTWAHVPGLTFETGDLLTAHLAGVPFDAVTCSATLHHVDLESGLRRLAELTAPGGVLVVAGLAADTSALDVVRSAAKTPIIHVVRLIRGWHDHGSPRQDPRESWSTVREVAERVLPGVVYRRRFYWRYTLVWKRPVTS